MNLKSYSIQEYPCIVAQFVQTNISFFFIIFLFSQHSYIIYIFYIFILYIMILIVDKYYRRIVQNIDNVTMKFNISALLVKSKEHDSKINMNKNNISENLTLIN